VSSQWSAPRGGVLASCVTASMIGRPLPRRCRRPAASASAAKTTSAAVVSGAWVFLHLTYATPKPLTALA